jgi:hypothetical protein
VSELMAPHMRRALEDRGHQHRGPLVLRARLLGHLPVAQLQCVRCARGVGDPVPLEDLPARFQRIAAWAPVERLELGERAA